MEIGNKLTAARTLYDVEKSNYFEKKISRLQYEQHQREKSLTPVRIDKKTTLYLEKSKITSEYLTQHLKDLDRYFEGIEVILDNKIKLKL